MTLSRPMVGHLAMLAFAWLISFSFTFGALVAGDIDPGVLTSLRFVVATAVLALVAKISGLSWRILLRNGWRWLIIGELFALYFITMFEALRVTTPVATAAVFTLTPFFAAGFGWVLIGMRANGVTLAALVLGAIGAVWVIFKADLSLFLALSIGTGERLIFFGVIAHAAIPALTRRPSSNSAALEAALGSSLGALIISSLYAGPEVIKTDFASLRPLVWGVALYLGLVTTAVTFILIQVAVPRIAPGKVMAYTYLLPSLVLGQSIVSQRQYEPALIYVGVILTLIALAVLVMQDTVSTDQSG